MEFTILRNTQYSCYALDQHNLTDSSGYVSTQQHTPYVGPFTYTSLLLSRKTNGV